MTKAGADVTICRSFLCQRVIPVTLISIAGHSVVPVGEKLVKNTPLRDKIAPELAEGRDVPDDVAYIFKLKVEELICVSIS